MNQVQNIHKKDGTSLNSNRQTHALSNTASNTRITPRRRHYIMKTKRKPLGYKTPGSFKLNEKVLLDNKLLGNQESKLAHHPVYSNESHKVETESEGDLNQLNKTYNTFNNNVKKGDNWNKFALDGFSIEDHPYDQSKIIQDSNSPQNYIWYSDKESVANPDSIEKRADVTNNIEVEELVLNPAKEDLILNSKNLEKLDKNLVNKDRMFSDPSSSPERQKGIRYSNIPVTSSNFDINMSLKAECGGDANIRITNEHEPTQIDEDSEFFMQESVNNSESKNNIRKDEELKSPESHKNCETIQENMDASEDSSFSNQPLFESSVITNSGIKKMFKICIKEVVENEIDSLKTESTRFNIMLLGAKNTGKSSF